VRRFAERAGRFGYELLITPVFEHVEVFNRLGESTDVVSKEMYEFTDRGNRHLALRPEGTAPVVRAYVQHKKHGPWKVWYLAPLFRYERQQKGRLREHYQLNVDIFGAAEVSADARNFDADRIYLYRHRRCLRALQRGPPRARRSASWRRPRPSSASTMCRPARSTRCSRW